MRLLELTQSAQDALSTARYDPAEDRINRRSPADTRKPIVTLKHLNRLKRLNSLRRLELIQREELMATMYGAPEDETGGLGGPPAF